jgi:hypothetical protein
MGIEEVEFDMLIATIGIEEVQDNTWRFGKSPVRRFL